MFLIPVTLRHNWSACWCSVGRCLEGTVQESSSFVLNIYTFFFYCTSPIILFPALQRRRLSANDEAALAGGGSEANGALRQLVSGACPSVRQCSQKKLKWEPLHPARADSYQLIAGFSPPRADSFDGWHLVRPFLHAATNKSNTGAAADKLLRAQNTRETGVPELCLALSHSHFVSRCS